MPTPSFWTSGTRYEPTTDGMPTGLASSLTAGRNVLRAGMTLVKTDWNGSTNAAAPIAEVEDL